MPELPEVETIRKALEKQITNKKIIDFHIGNKKLRFDLPEKFKQLVIGQTVMKPLRVGKFCLLPLCSGKNILIHLGMSGKIKITTSKTKLDIHDHAIIEFDDGTFVIYNDQRRFGFLDLTEKDIFTNKFIKKLGPDSVSKKFNAIYLFGIIKFKERNIKNILLDQSIVAGLGNIYVNEALHLSKISPNRRGKNISLKKCYDLIKNIKIILKNAIKAGGTTIKDHMQPDGSLGYFKQKLRVYGKSGYKCIMCKAKIKEIKQSGRTSFYCGVCQR